MWFFLPAYTCPGRKKTVHGKNDGSRSVDGSPLPGHTLKINECLPRATSSGFRIKFMKVKCLVIDVIKYL